ncbi:MAG: hypothetical protein VX899_11550 [Myxococcota bacterium]|nr:hypothetical protein [Myxococcota bacterium]
MILALAAFLACEPQGGPSTKDTEDTAPELDDLDGPAISHEQVESPQAVGSDITISVNITDDTQVLVASLKFRRQTAPEWENAGLVLTDPETGLYEGKISAEDLGSGGMHYYFEAVDTLQNTSVWPEAAPDEYFKFDLYEE